MAINYQSSVTAARVYGVGSSAGSKSNRPTPHVRPGSIIRETSCGSNRYIQFAGRDGEFRSTQMPQDGGQSYSALRYDFPVHGSKSRSSFFIGVGPETKGTIVIHKGNGEWANIGRNGQLLEGDLALVREAFKTMREGLNGSEHLISPQIAQALGLIKVCAESLK
jgi:hypothetical protein